MSELDDQIAAAEKEWTEKWVRGPKRTRWKKIPLQIGDNAPDILLENLDGKPVHLNSFWRDKPALVMFWRHYGCSCGRERAEQLKVEYPKYTERSANLVVVGQGEPARSAEYAKRHAIPCPVLCDPAYKAYEAYDLLEGKPSQVLFDGADDLLKCDFDAGMEFCRSRHGTELALVDSPWQLPGEFVVDQRGVVRLAYRYQYCEDWPNPLVLAAAIKEAIWDIA